mgnify:CR=1 FL=1
MLDEAKDKKKIDIKGKEFDSKNIVDVEPTLDEAEEGNSLIESICDEELQEVMNRMQRRKAGISARKNKHKMKRGREKAMRKTATMEVLKKRARKAGVARGPLELLLTCDIHVVLGGLLGDLQLFL